MTDIIKEFENNGMVKVLKKAQDFDELQYNLLLKLFRDIALPLQKKELLEKIEEYGCNEKNCQEGHYPISYNEENDETEWGGCPNCTSGGIRLEPYKTVDDIIRIIKEI